MRVNICCGVFARNGTNCTSQKFTVQNVLYETVQFVLSTKKYNLYYWQMHVSICCVQKQYKLYFTKKFRVQNVLLQKVQFVLSTKKYNLYYVLTYFSELFVCICEKQKLLSTKCTFENLSQYKMYFHKNVRVQNVLLLKCNSTKCTFQTMSWYKMYFSKFVIVQNVLSLKCQSTKCTFMYFHNYVRVQKSTNCIRAKYILYFCKYKIVQNSTNNGIKVQKQYK